MYGAHMAGIGLGWAASWRPTCALCGHEGVHGEAIESPGAPTRCLGCRVREAEVASEAETDAEAAELAEREAAEEGAGIQHELDHGD